MKKGTKFKRIGAKGLADLPPMDQQNVVDYGEDVGRKAWALHLAKQFSKTVREVDSQNLTPKIFKQLKPTRPPKASHATIEDFEAWHRTPAMLAFVSKELVCEVANIVAEAAKTGNVCDLRALADAIEAVHKWEQWGGGGDELRTFILLRFRGFKRVQEFTGTFPEARQMIAKRFSDFPDDPQLRKLFAEHGVKFPPAKPGRKREV